MDTTRMQRPSVIRLLIRSPAEWKPRNAHAWDPSSCLTHGERGNNVRLRESPGLPHLVRSKYGPFKSAMRVAGRTLEASVEAAGAVGGAAVNGVVGGVQGALSG